MLKDALDITNNRTENLNFRSIFSFRAVEAYMDTKLAEEKENFPIDEEELEEAEDDKGLLGRIYRVLCPDMFTQDFR